VLDDLVEEVACDQALALQAALHVAQREQHGVDLARVDRGREGVERERRSGHRRNV
jgi:hypothetical protein